MSSEEEIHMLPSVVKGYPLTCRPQNGLVLVPSLPAELSREIGEKEVLRHFLGFKWRKGNVDTFSGDGVQMEKRKCGYIFWRTGFILAIESYRQATGVQIGDWGSLFWQKGVLRHFLGFKCRDLRIVCAEKIFGVQENEKKEKNSGFKKSRKRK